MRLPNQMPAIVRYPSVNSETAAIEPSECSALKKIGCATAIAACATACYGTFGAACAACLASVGGSGCYDCF